MTIDEMIAVLQAAKEGKTIEIMVNPKVPQHGWQAADLRSALYVMSHGDPARVKPEPREVWMVFAKDGRRIASDLTRENAMAWKQDSGVNVVHFREVIE